MREAAGIAKRTGTHTDPHYGPCTNGLALEIKAAILAAIEKKEPTT